MTFDFKNSSNERLHTEYSRIAKEMGDDMLFTRRELNHLPAILFEGEQILAFSSGIMDGSSWLITLTDKRVILLNKGLIYGLEQTIIDLDKITAISGKTGIVYGKIEIICSPEPIIIKDVLKRTVVPFINKARDAIESQKNSKSPSKEENQIDSITKLERLANLLDKGVLTKQEFLQQKAKILNE